MIRAVDGIDFAVHRGEVFGLVGESGCGKTVTALSIMRLVPAPGQIVSGEMIFDGLPLHSMSESEMDDVRGRRIAMIFQDPHQRLNPVFTVGTQLAEVFQVHSRLGNKAARERALDLFIRVGMPDPERIMHAYPHEISGGQAQRVMIAMAIALEPDLIIADEPTSALDVTIQAQILDLLRSLGRARGTAVILISHDLGVVAGLADRLAVMYSGRLVERGDVEGVYQDRYHPYTRGLLASIPSASGKDLRLVNIPGQVPDPLSLPPGCRFAPRCSAREENNLTICEIREPDLLEKTPGHAVRCWLYQESG